MKKKRNDTAFCVTMIFQLMMISIDQKYEGMSFVSFLVFPSAFICVQFILLSLCKPPNIYLWYLTLFNRTHFFILCINRRRKKKIENNQINKITA